MFAPLLLQILSGYIYINKFYIHIWKSRYDKLLETHDYFQYVNINVVFLLNNFLFYMQDTVQQSFDTV